MTYGAENIFPVKFGDFLLLDFIGKGGMAEIFLALAKVSLGMEKILVIKKILPSLSRDYQFSELFIQEAKLSSILTHKNIVQVFNLGRIEDQLYIAMEYVEGFDLNKLLKICTKKQIPFTLEFSLFIIMEILRALDYAHRVKDESGKLLGIIHRDISPTNVLISLEGEVKLCDFGIAKAIKWGPTLPEETLKGKFAYMSPEQARGEVVDQRSDLFSVGILLWELVAGRRMYKAQNEEELIQMVQLGDYPKLPERGFPEEKFLHSIIYKALNTEPQNRYQSAREFLIALEEYVFKTHLMPNQLKFSTFLKTNLNEEIQKLYERREEALSKARAFLELEVDDESESEKTIKDSVGEDIQDAIELVAKKREDDNIGGGEEAAPMINLSEKIELPSHKVAQTNKTFFILFFITLIIIVTIIVLITYLMFKV